MNKMVVQDYNHFVNYWTKRFNINNKKYKFEQLYFKIEISS